MEATADGRVSTSMAVELTRHVKSVGTNLLHPTAPNVSKALKSSWQDLESGNTVSSRQWAQVALDYSWEQLNMGKWEEVGVVWREVYATAALLKALALTREGERQRALEELDRGILLGAPILDSALHSFATSLSSSMTSPGASLAAPSTTERARAEASKDAEAAVRGGKKKIVFRNYKQFRESGEDVIHSDEKKRPRIGINVHDLASRRANVPLVDSECKIQLVYLPSLSVFHHDYMHTRTPVVISGAMDTWPAYAARKWRQVYYKSVYASYIISPMNFLV